MFTRPSQEVKALMEVHPIAVTLAVLLVVGVVGGVQNVRLRRALRGECAARRLAAARHHSDAEAMFRRIQRVALEAEVLEAADLILDSALAVHHRNEGGPL